MPTRRISRGVGRLDHAAADLDAPGGERVAPEQRAGELGPAGADEPGEAQDLARPKVEADVLEHARPGEAAHAQERRAARGGPGGFCASASASASPIINSTMRLRFISASGRDATLRPSRSTVTRSAIASISASR